MQLFRSAVGVDLGAYAVKAVKLRIAGGQAIVERSLCLDKAALEARGVLLGSPPAGNGAGGGPSPARDRLAKALREAMAAAGISTRSVVLSVDGKESIIRYTHVPPMPAWRLDMIMKYEVEAVTERMGEPVASDFVSLPIHRDVDGDQTILLGLAKETPLLSLLESLEGAGITVARALPAPVALYGAWDLFATKLDPDDPEDDLVLIADLGATSLSMAIVLNDRLAFARSVSFGGDNFTAALGESMGVGPEEAERIKVTCGGVDPSLSAVHHKTVAPLRTAAGQLVGLLQSSLRFCGGQTGISLPPLRRLWLTGGGMRLHGLSEYLSRALRSKSVELFDPAGRENGSSGDKKNDPSSAPGSLALALGLSSAGLGSGGQGPTKGAPSPTSLTILPIKYRERRKFWERTVFLYATAGCLLLVIVAQLILGVYKSSRASATLATLQSTRNALNAQKQEMLESAETSRMARARINRLLREAEPTAFQAFLLDFLGRRLQPEVQVEEVNLEVIEREDASGFDYQVTLKGRVNDEKRRGRDLFREVRSLLIAEERVRNVQVLEAEPRGAWYHFVVAIEPNTLSV